MVDFGYGVADQIDIDFYAEFNIAPLGLLSDCGYENLQRLHIEVGMDVCEHVEEHCFKCEDCEHSKPQHLYYTPIGHDVIVNLLIFAGTTGLQLPYYTGDIECKKVIYEHIKNKCWSDPTLRQKVVDLLQKNLLW